MKKYIKSVMIAIIMFSFPIIVNASGNASISFSGDNSVTEGKEITLKAQITGVSGVAGSGIVSVGGNISFDSSYLQYVSGTGASSPYNFQINPGNNYKVAGLDTSLQNGILSNTTFLTLKFKAIKTGSTKVSFTNGKLTDSTGVVQTSFNSKTITINEPASTNNNLSSLTVSEGSIDFNKNTTSYKISVGADVTSINVNATAEDNKASVSGQGSKNLNYGNNTIKINVKAEDGSTKTYTITVTRKDDRSTNNNLSSMSVTNGTLSPGFSKGTQEYSIEVPYSVSSLNIKYETEDSKAKVSISGNNLVAEKTTTVSVVVTAENGSKKTYTIKAKRGKDPNKKLSKDNYLNSLSVNVGILSPVFDKEKVNYIVYLPYEVTSIDFNAEVSDTEYATISWNKPENLGVGDNIYEAVVKAEDESTRTYKIIVVRGASLEDAKTDSSTGLKSLKVENGKLKTSFSNSVHFYTYEKGKEALKIFAVANDVNSTVNVLNDGDIYTVLVESAGEKAVYILAPEEKTNMMIFIVIGIIVLVLLIIIILLIIKNKKHKKEIKNIKEQKAE